MEFVVGGVDLPFRLCPFEAAERWAQYQCDIWLTRLCTIIDVKLPSSFAHNRIGVEVQGFSQVVSILGDMSSKRIAH